MPHFEARELFAIIKSVSVRRRRVFHICASFFYKKGVIDRAWRCAVLQRSIPKKEIVEMLLENR